jgi:hypothetical protein
MVTASSRLARDLHHHIPQQLKRILDNSRRFLAGQPSGNLADKGRRF